MKSAPAGQLIFLIFMVAIFYFLLIRPQRVYQKKRQNMLNALNVGDKIITTGGIYGTIMKVNEQSLRVKIAKNVEVRIARSGVSSVTKREEPEE
ncbi:MAG: preprotein translocase subunit YajC [bacterium]